MPNIMVYGMKPAEWDKIREIIKSLVEDFPFRNLIVYTFVHSVCCDLDGHTQPYFRICSSDKGHFEPLRRLLEIFGDVETEPIGFSVKKTPLTDEITLPVLEPGCDGPPFKYETCKVSQKEPNVDILFSQSGNALGITIEALPTAETDFYRKNVLLRLVNGNGQTVFWRKMKLSEKLLGSVALNTDEFESFWPTKELLRASVCLV